MLSYISSDLCNWPLTRRFRCTCQRPNYIKSSTTERSRSARPVSPHHKKELGARHGVSAATGVDAIWRSGSSTTTRRLACASVTTCSQHPRPVVGASTARRAGSERSRPHGSVTKTPLTVDPAVVPARRRIARPGENVTRPCESRLGSTANRFFLWINSLSDVRSCSAASDTFTAGFGLGDTTLGNCYSSLPVVELPPCRAVGGQQEETPCSAAGEFSVAPACSHQENFSFRVKVEKARNSKIRHHSPTPRAGSQGRFRKINHPHAAKLMGLVRRRPGASRPSPRATAPSHQPQCSFPPHFQPGPTHPPTLDSLLRIRI
jgi:hypothetical protein